VGWPQPQREADEYDGDYMKKCLEHHVNLREHSFLPFPIAILTWLSWGNKPACSLPSHPLLLSTSRTCGWIMNKRTSNVPICDNIPLMDGPWSHRCTRPSHPLPQLGYFPLHRVRRHVGRAMVQPLRSGRDAWIRYRLQSPSAAQDKRDSHLARRLAMEYFLCFKPLSSSVMHSPTTSPSSTNFCHWHCHRFHRI